MIVDVKQSPSMSPPKDPEKAWRELAEEFGLSQSGPELRRWTEFMEYKSKKETFWLDRENDMILMKPRGIRNVTVSFYFDHIWRVKDLVREGFQLSKYWLIQQNGVGVLSLTKKNPITDTMKVCLLCLDVEATRILGCVNVVCEQGNEDLVDIDVFECALSRNKRTFALSFGVVCQCDYGEPSFKCMVYLYDTSMWMLMKRFESTDCVTPALALNSSLTCHHIAIVGLREEGGQPQIGVFDLGSGTWYRKHKIDLFNINPETCLKLTYTGDGCFLVLQVLEAMGYGKRLLHTSYIIDAETLQVVTRCKPAMTSLLQVTCAPWSLPVTSNKQPCLALVSLTKDESVVVNCYDLPAKTDLKVKQKIPTYLWS